MIMGAWGLGRKPKLPYDAEVAYLESTGAQWIALGLLGEDGYEFSYKFRPLTPLPCAIGGEYETSKSTYIGLVRPNGNLAYHYKDTHNNIVEVCPITSGSDYEITARFASGEQYVIVNGVKYNTGTMSGDFVSSLYMRLFSINSYNPLYSYMRLYYFKAWLNGILVRDFKPVRFTNEQGVSEGAMYDKVSKQLFRNAGTGAFIIGPDKGWTNPYITDGLVAMWDGEWNAGGGVHDSAAETWKDLSGHQKDFSWAGGATGLAWADNYLQLTNANKTEIEISSVQNVIGLNVGEPKTCEIVVAFNWVFTDITGNLQMPFSIGGAAFPCGRFNGQIVPMVARDAKNKFLAFGQTKFQHNEWKIASASIAQSPISPCTIHCNGDVKTVSSDYVGNADIEYDSAKILRSPRADARLYSVRIYSRTLTASEISANYAVDKQRFSLP